MSAFEYEQDLSNVAFRDAADAGTNAYQRFLSNRNYQRQSGDMARDFRAQQPKFGAHFAARGLTNSGIHRSDSRNRFREYQDVQTRLAENEMATQTNLSNQAAVADQDRIRAILQAFEKFQAGRAQEDPFASFYNPFQSVVY